MAHQAGPLRFRGKLGGLSFYHNKQYGYLVRIKGGPRKGQIATSPKFARTRENAAEFAIAASAGKLLRRAIRAATGLTGDSNVTQRLTGLLVTMGKTDHFNERGLRSPVSVFSEPASQLLLRSFAFYKVRPLFSVYTGRIVCDASSGLIVLTTGSEAPAHASDFFDAPKGATHVRIRGAIISLDFETNSYTNSPVSAYVGRLEDMLLPIEFNVDAGSTSTDKSGIVAIEFLQEQNGELYLLGEGLTLGIIS